MVIHRQHILARFLLGILEEWIQIRMMNNFSLMYKMNILLDKLHIEIDCWDKNPINSSNIVLFIHRNILRSFHLCIKSMFQDQEYTLMDKLHKHLQGMLNLVRKLMLKHHMHNQQRNWNMIQDCLNYMKSKVAYN